MNLLNTQLLALRAIRRNKLRSFLTVLGIIIGVGAVIAMVAIGDGAKRRVESTFQAMGTNMLIVQPGSTQAGGVRGGGGTGSTLTWADLKAIQKLPTVRLAVPQLSARAQVITDYGNWNTQVRGTTPEYFDVRNWPMSSGSPFAQSDVDTGTKVIVLGQTVVDNTFGPGSDPVGSVVRLNQVPFEVVGVATKKGQSSFGQDYDDSVWVPHTTFSAKISGGFGNYLNGVILVSATSASDTTKCQSQITALLRDQHHLRRDTEDDFQIRNMAEVASAAQESTATFTLLLAGIAFVSLVVGGIGIMNIMLVSVTERTREIGIRMAVGAKPRQILAQFIIESVTLSAIGGLIGLGAGVGAARGMNYVYGWEVVVQPQIALLAVSFSAAVGIIFGLYPAWRASRLDPIQALRYE